MPKQCRYGAKQQCAAQDPAASEQLCVQQQKTLQYRLQASPISVAVSYVFDLRTTAQNRDTIPAVV